MCTAEDFIKNGYDDISDEFGNVIKARLCPDVPDEAPWYMVKNDYANVTERMSVSLQIVKCNQNLDKD